MTSGSFASTARRRIGVYALTLVGILFPQLSRAQSPNPPAAQNTIAFFGCEVDATDVLIRARPVTRTSPGPPDQPPGPPDQPPGPPDLDRIDFDPSNGARMVHPTSTGAPGEFTFVFDDLEPATIYRIGAKLTGETAQRCGRIAWNTNRDSLIVPGDDPLALEAYALRSEFQVLGAASGRRREAWVGAENVDFFDRAAATRQFRWRTTLPDATGGVVQFALRPFPRPGRGRVFDPCDSSAVFYSRTFQKSQGTWTDIGAINLNQVLTTVDPGGGVFPPLAGNSGLQFQLGRPVYVRVVPTSGDRLLCAPEEAGAPSEVLLSKVLKAVVEGQPGTDVSVDGPADYRLGFIDPKHPVWGVSERCYRLIKPHTPQPGALIGYLTIWDYYLATRGDAEGRFCVVEGSGDDGWFESFTSSIASLTSEAIDGLGEMVNFASKLWEDIQDTVVDGVAAGLDGLGVPCDPDCRSLLETGLEIGLASMGIPPSIPNFDGLKQMGVDYLAHAIAAETGVPEPIAELATNKAKEFAEKAITKMRESYSVSGLPNWLARDIRLDPPVLVLRVWGTGLPLAAKPLVIRGSDPIFAFANFVLPIKLPHPSQPSVAVPMVLMPNLADLPEPGEAHTDYGMSVWFKNKWYTDRFKNGCYHLVLTALVPGDVIALFAANFFAASALPCSQ
jgi:hypothetical protein